MKKLSISLTLAIIFLQSFPCKANLNFVNRSTEEISVAIAYWESGRFVSEGWWNIEPGEKIKAWTGNASDKNFYYYAYSSTGTWKGDYSFCTKSTAFTIYGDDKCSSRGYNSRGFVKRHSSNYDFTISLTENETNKDVYYRGIILGTWKMTEYEDGNRVTLECSYSKGGYYSWTADMYVDGIELFILGSGKWSIYNGYLKETITSSTVPELMPVGYEDRSKISSASTSRIKFYDSSTGEYYTYRYVEDD